MKDKILKIFVLFLIFLISLGLIYLYKKPLKLKVLKVIEADEFAIDFNKNNKIDKDEVVKLKNIVVLKPYKTYFDSKFLIESGLSYDEILKVGYLAKYWVNNELLNNEVFVYNKNKCLKNEICYVDIYYKNKNLSKVLLKNGLAYIPNTSSSKKYYPYLNLKAIKNNALELSKLKFYLKNSDTKIIHELKCEYAKEISKAEILLKKDLDFKNNIFCKKCFLKQQKIYLPKTNIPKSKGIYKKSIFKNFKNVDLYLINPLEYSFPSEKARTNFSKRLIFEINNSKESIDVALYDFGLQKEIFDALLKAKNRGVKIRAISDKSKNEDFQFSMKSDFIKEFDVVLDRENSLMHNKFFIFDNKLVMSGSANISSTGSGGYNSNCVVFIKDDLVVQKYKKEFEQMFESKFSKNKKIIEDKNSDIEVYFSPKDDIYHKVLASLIKNALHSIYVSAFYLTDGEFIEDLISAKKRGVEVIIILDATSANAFKKRVEYLRNNGIILAVEDWGGKNHEKTISIDNKILILGSCNFSKSGFYKNDENILIFKNPQMAALYSDYFLYLLNSINKKFFFKIPRAEGFDSKNSCFDGIDNNFDGKIDKMDDACK